MALNGWAAPSRPCSGPAIASLPVGAQLLVQGSVLSSTAAGPTRRTLLLRLDEVELLVLPTETEAEAGAVAVGAGDEPAMKRPAPSAELGVDVDAGSAGASAALAAWLSVKGARRLLVQGVGVEVAGRLIASGDGSLVLQASSVRLVAALPEPAFVARVLRLPELGALVCGDSAASGNVAMIGLAGALQPCTVAQCGSLRAECLANPTALPFKSKALLELCAKMRNAQGWSSAKGQKRNADASRPPKARTWEAVLRMEERWNPDGSRFRQGYGCGEEEEQTTAEGEAALPGPTRRPDDGIGAAEGGGAVGPKDGDAEWLLGSAEPMLHMPIGEQTVSRLHFIHQQSPSGL